MRKFGGLAWVLMALFMVTGFQVSDAAEQLIKEFVDLIQERGTAEWVDAYGRPVGLEGPDTDRNLLQMRPIYDPEAAARGDEPSLGLYMEAKPAPGDMEFGLEGQFTVQLPAQRFYQFQGFAHVQNGEARGTNVKVLVQTRPDLLSDWTTAQIFTGEKLGTTAINDELKEDILAFVLDLSDWAGDEVRIVLSMNVVPAYSKVGPEESWTPNVISAQWTSARIVGSAFRVILGEPEKVGDLSSVTSKASALQEAQAQVQSVTAYPISAEELILRGTSAGQGGDWHMINPAESGVNTTYLPADGSTPGRFVAYITTPLAPNTVQSATYAYPRLIDFRNQTTKHMGNATANEIYNASYVDPSSGGARMVIWPTSLTDDDWPGQTGHVAFASVWSSNYTDMGGGTVNVLHAFAHVEDNDQNDDGIKNTAGTYEHIGYVRSRTGYEDFGRTFNKTNHSAGNAIIRYVSPEQDITMLAYPSKLYGCGGASVFGTTDYYYMIYHARPTVKNVTGEDDTLAAGIAIARATKTAIDTWTYPYSNNPWTKYRQIVSATTSHLNWGQPGIGGVETILWNSLKENGLRSPKTDNQKLWRAFPKISYNVYLATPYVHQMVMICKGGIDKNESKKTGIALHTSNNLLEWSEFLIIKADQIGDGVHDYYTYEYPTLVGWDTDPNPPDYGGYSGQTCEYNKLYYQRDIRRSGVALDKDLYRLTLRFQTP